MHEIFLFVWSQLEILVCEHFRKQNFSLTSKIDQHIAEDMFMAWIELLYFWRLVLAALRIII